MTPARFDSVFWPPRACSQPRAKARVVLYHHVPMLEHELSLAVEEQLDVLDPLRHLRNDDIVPAQPPSVLNQTLELCFPSSANDPVTVQLVVDASPGCGGIAWPAGEVGLRVPPSP